MGKANVMVMTARGSVKFRGKSHQPDHRRLLCFIHRLLHTSSHKGVVPVAEIVGVVTQFSRRRMGIVKSLALTRVRINALIKMGAFHRQR